MNAECMEQLAEKPFHWLSVHGPEAGVVVSTRIRLARNLAHTHFPGRASMELRKQIMARCFENLAAVPPLDNGIFFEMSELATAARNLMLERRLITGELARSGAGSGVFISRSEELSTMVNEEDHLRIQILKPGLQLKEAWQCLRTFDSALMSRLEFAHSDTLGFLTACPSNVGTGMRASVMLHLPGLMLAGRLESSKRAVQKLGFALRGMFGEGSASAGNMCQVSNQSTLGESEDQIIRELEELVRKLLWHERSARLYLVRKKREIVYDYIGRAYGTLAYARVLTPEEAIERISALRLGIDLRIIRGISVNDLNTLMLKVLPAHMDCHQKEVMSQQKRDMRRADLFRTFLKKNCIDD